jgi:Family of unknown function (DUF6519)/Carboxypeptidase regulatory-like domain
MKGDFTRSTWNPKKHYSGVRQQQGRVQLDADWNEQVDIDAYLRETGLADLIGRCGAPWTGGGFKVEVAPDDSDLIVSPGRLYVDGILCELEPGPEVAISPSFPASDLVGVSSEELRRSGLRQGDRVEVLSDFSAPNAPGAYARVLEILPQEPDGDAQTIRLDISLVSDRGFRNPRLRRVFTYTSQPGLPGAALPEAPGTYFAYLHVWQRHVTALEDPEIREKALGGPDTATRTQTFWRIRLLRVDADDHCLSAPRSWLDEIAPPSGRMKAQAPPAVPPKDPCIIPANAGYTRLENQLYRVEVHQGGKLGDKATFKWSRDNGSVVTEWLEQDAADPKKIKVKSAGRDKVLGFEAGRWIELTDDTHEIESKPGPLAKLLAAEGDVLTLDIDPTQVKLADFPVNPKARRWDSNGEVAIAQPADNGGWLKLEDGIEVRFEGDIYKTGDYWLIPARAFIGESSGDIEWPRDDDGKALAVPPHGVAHHYCKLAVVQFARGRSRLKGDCRTLFPPATELIHIAAAGGDGQEAPPGQELPCALAVGVTNGRWPVEGVRVRFEVDARPEDQDEGVERQGTLSAPGQAGPRVTVPTSPEGIAECRWTLPELFEGGESACLRVTASLRDAADQPVAAPVFFHASFRLAGEEGFHVRTILDAFGRPLENDSLVDVFRLEGGLRIVCDAPLALEPFTRIESGFRDGIPAKPTCFVTLDLPYPIEGNERETWGVDGIIGFQPTVLAAKLEVEGVEGNVISWIPTPATTRWLLGQLFDVLSRRQVTDRVLAHLVLKGNVIWRRERPGVFLDGNAFGRPGDGRVDLTLPSGDRRRGGDFEMWFWLGGRTQDRGRIDVRATPNGIFGLVRDVTGAPLAGIVVTLTGAGVSRTATTDAQGQFRFPGLAPGIYTVQAAGAPSETVTVSPGPGGPVRLVREIPGIGGVFASRLEQEGVTTVSELAALPPARLATILNVSEDRAGGFIEAARALLNQ